MMKIEYSNPRISVITLNYNQIKVTCEFLDSFVKTDYDNYEIILIDNASTTNPGPVIKEKYPHVKFIRSEVNLGFTGGNNLGYSHADGDYIFVVNNDTEVTENLLSNLAETLQKDDKLGVVCPKIKFYENPSIIQYAGFTQINQFTGRNKAVGNGEEDRGQYDESYYTNYAHGAAMMIKREVIELIGLFPDFFFIYYEELDFSARVSSAGYAIAYQPNAEIYHKESITMGKESPSKVYYMTRNRILFMRRNFATGKFLIFAIFFTFLSLPKNIIKYLVQRKFDLVNSYLKGAIWNLYNGKNE
jgi:GT2 family glycosyltransferase